MRITHYVLLLLTIVGVRAQAQTGCLDCLYTSVDQAVDTAYIVSLWESQGISYQDTSLWAGQDSLLITCDEDIIVTAIETFDLDSNLIASNHWIISEQPTWVFDPQITLDSTLFNTRDTVFTDSCEIREIFWVYNSTDTTGYTCNEELSFSGLGAIREMSFPVGSGTITIDFEAFMYVDTLQIFGAGGLLFDEVIGTNGNFPNNVEWDNGTISPFTGSSPLGSNGFVRVILSVEDNCDLRIVAKSGPNSGTAWNIFVHCCPDCYQPDPVEVVMDTILCSAGIVDGVPITQDTSFAKLSQTLGGCDSVTLFNVHVSMPTIDSFSIIEPSCFGFENGNIQTWTSVTNPIFFWNNGANTAINEDIGAGNYSVTVTDIYGCTHSDSLVLHEPPLLESSLVGIEPLCYGDNNGSLELFYQGGIGPYAINWSTGDLDVSLLDSLKTGEYDVTIVDNNNCISQSQLFIDQPDSLEISLFVTNATCLGIADGEIESNVRGGTFPYDYVWSTGSEDLSISDLLIGDFSLSITDSHGCHTSKSSKVDYLKRDATYIPNAFSPNYDWVNDKFIPYGSECIVEIKEFLIFDRWGEELFAQRSFPPNDESYGWDGTFRGEEMQTGVYVWYAIVQYHSGKNETLKGSIQILRWINVV